MYSSLSFRFICVSLEINHVKKAKDNELETKSFKEEDKDVGKVVVMAYLKTALAG